MIRPQFTLDVNSELIADNFAGGGGASTGIELALGRHVDHAVNHDQFALGMHRINHPQTIHHCEDIFDVDPLTMTEGRRVGLGWFSPDCKHFSKAKGGKPLDKKIRGLVLVIYRWAAIRTRVIFMENVEEIQTWGPLYTDHSDGCKGSAPGKCKDKCRHGRPMPEHKGRTWDGFKAALGSGIDPNHPDIPEMLDVLGGTITKAQLVQGFGYTLDTKEIRACDFGAPTIRKRLFMIARCDGLPIVWPKPTHFAPADMKRGRKPWRVVAECIDWDRPCPSIFLTKAEAKEARCKRPLANSTLRRVATGVGRYVINAKEPFLVSLTHQGEWSGVEPVSKPMKTVTGAHRGEKAVVDAALAPFVSDSSRPQEEKGASAGEPMRTACAGTKRGHMQVVAPVLAREFGQSVGQPVDAPAPTVMPAGQGKTALVAPVMMQRAHFKSNSQMVKGANEPMRTQAASGEHCVISANLVRTAHGDVDKKGKRRGRGAHPVTEPLPSTLASQDLALVAGTLIQTGYGEREGQAPRVPGIDKPLGTVVAGGGKHAVVAASLMVNATGHPGGPATQPLKTIATGGHHHLVAANLVEYHSPKRPGDERTKPVDQPLPVQTTEPRFGLVAAHLTQFKTGAVGKPMDVPAPTVLAGSHSPDTHGGAASTLGVVAANLVKLRGDVKTHSKGAPVDEPGHTASAGGQHHALSSCYLAQNNFDRVGKDAREPITTITGKGHQQPVISAYLAQHNAGFNTTPGHEATEPISTISAKGSQQQVVSASLNAYYGTEKDGQGIGEPLRTISTKARFGMATAHAFAPIMTEAQIAGAHRVAKFLRRFGVVFEGEFATVAGFIIVDIGMRMLMPRELFRAQGFGDEFVIDRAWLIDPHTGMMRDVKLTKEQQIRMCGNSVCPPVAAALVRSNVPEMAAWTNREYKRRFKGKLVKA